jgi:hypothetical protein
LQVDYVIVSINSEERRNNVATRKTGVETSKTVASIASQGLKDPGSLTKKQIQQVSAAALANTQGPTVPVKPKKSK